MLDILINSIKTVQLFHHREYYNIDINMDMSIAFPISFSKLSGKGHLRDLYRGEDDIKIGFEETVIVCKQAEWPLPSPLPMAEGSKPKSLLLVNFSNEFRRCRATHHYT
jgi:hypothetical protein